MTVRPSTPAFARAVLALVLSSNAACGLTVNQKASISEFGHATSTVAAVSGEQFPRYRQRTIEMNRLAWILDRTGKRLSEKQPDGRPADGAYYRSQLVFDDGLGPEHVAVRTAATEVLAAYGDALVTFSQDSQADEMEAATDRLVASVEAFPEREPLLERAKVEELGKVVQIVGNLWIDWRRRRAVERIVPIGVELVDGLCTRLEIDLDTQKNGIAHVVANAQDNLEEKTFYWLRQPPARVLSERALPLEAYELSAQTRMELDVGSKQGLAAVAALRKANRQLGEMVANRTYSIADIKDFVTKARELAAALQAVAA